MRFLEKLFAERFEISAEGEILRRRPFCPVEVLKKAEIAQWRVEPEMGFDVVRIRLESGKEIVWFDKRNDLLSALRDLAPDKERGA